MYLVRLECDGLRSLTEIKFDPGPGLNIICGNNAQGKTSLLEAILFATTSKSHRTNQDAHLVKHGAEGFRIKARVQRRDRDVCIEAHWWQGAKRFKVNGVVQERFSDILGKVNVVFSSPEDMALVRGSATHRRRFLDMELSQLHPGYLKALQQYREVLRQRNELLRHTAPEPSLLEVWEVRLAQYGKVLVQTRREFVKGLSGLMTDAYHRIAGEEVLDVRYAPDVAAEESLPEVLAGSRRSDLRRGVTLRGPHRDDLRFFVDGQPARVFASQGQSKTAALALKLAEWELVKERTGEYPILMVDDALSDLDAARFRRLFDALPQEGQCLLTTTNLSPHDVIPERNPACFLIERGRLAKQ